MQRTDFLIVGAGPAGVSAAAALRTLGVSGTIALVSGEVDPPHDRPPLSKAFLRGERSRAQVLLHPPEFYAANRIVLTLGRPALSLDLAARAVVLADGDTIRFGRLLLATGGRPRKLGAPGETTPGVYELRTLAEAERIKAAAAEARCPVVVGAGPIGIDVAASLTALGLPPTVLNLDEQVWPGRVPSEAAQAIQQELEARGVRFHHRTRVTSFDGKDRLERVCTNAGDFEADLAVVGAGLQPNTELAAAAGLQVDGGIVVDEHLRTSAANVFAAGDVASFPDGLGGRRQIDHWDNAVAQGRVAAANMAGQRAPFRHVPQFRSDLFDLTVDVVGSLDGAEETIVRGALESRRFTLLALRDGALRGALMANRAGDRAPLTELIRHQAPIDGLADKLADPSFDLGALVD